MIHRIYSDLSSFKELTFRAGLNIVMTETSEGATDKQTRNRAGKSSLIEIIHFLTGASANQNSIFRRDRLAAQYFGMVFDLGDTRVDVRRSGAQQGIIVLISGSTEGWPEQPETTFSGQSFSLPKWRINLGKLMFGLTLSEVTESHENDSAENNSTENNQVRSAELTFRNLYAYFVRRQASNGFIEPGRNGNKQQTGDMQMALMFLLGLDWTIARDREQLRRQERISKAIGQGALVPPPSIPNSRVGMAELRAVLAIEENRIERLAKTVNEFQVYEDYETMESEASTLTRDIRDLINQNVSDRISVNQIRFATEVEDPPTYDNLREMYEEAGITLPGVAVKTFDQVVQFHQTIVANRRSYLLGELNAAEQRILDRDRQIRQKERRKAEIMAFLSAHGALEQWSSLNAELGRRRNETNAIRIYMSQREKVERDRAEFSIQKNQLRLRLQQDFSEQEGILNRAIFYFQEISTELYGEKEHGFLSVDATDNGPTFSVKIHGAESTGVSKMQIFCFDMVLMLISSERKIGPGYLVHDSHIFDGADARQVAKALEIGARYSREFGFQYVVTLNSDQISERQWFSEGFEVDAYILEPRLSDKTDDGGLFGFRFS